MSNSLNSEYIGQDVKLTGSSWEWEMEDFEIGGIVRTVVAVDAHTGLLEVCDDSGSNWVVYISGLRYLEDHVARDHAGWSAEFTEEWT